MENYKSWSGLRKQLHGFLCESLQDRVSYFLTRYHDVHNSYGRAAISVDGKELVLFSWTAMYQQDDDRNRYWKETGMWEDEPCREKWDRDGTWCDMDFLDAALKFRNLPIQDALESENFIIKCLAIMDRRVGKRMLQKIADQGRYREYPGWVRQFYDLRLTSLFTD